MIGWLDCSAGISGDMLLGALVDVGVPLGVLQAAVDAVGVEPVRLVRSDVVRGGIGACKVDVQVADSAVTRTWSDVRDLIESARLADGVRSRALSVFARLAVAEAAVHRVGVDDVHFHEVGALDAVADIVCCAAGLDHLRLDRLTAGTVTVGSGTTRGAHGPLPVPPPAVLHLLTGAPVQAGPVAREMTTPTGAALLVSSVQGFGPLPPLLLHSSGSGAGGRDPAELANVLRLVLGDAVLGDAVLGDAVLGDAVLGDAVLGDAVLGDAVLGAAAAGDAVLGAAAAGEGATAPPVLLLSTNVDDLDPRLWPGVLEAVLAAGAHDAWLTPIVMKKGRPAHTLSVLCPPAAAAEVREVVFRESSTLGLREQLVGRTVLDRTERTVHVNGQPVRVKLGLLAGEVVNAMPEWADVAAAAAALGRSAKSVLTEAHAAAAELPSG